MPNNRKFYEVIEKQGVFVYYGGIQKLTALMKAAVVQLKAFNGAVASDDNNLSDLNVEKTKLLQKILVYVVSIICSFVDLNPNVYERAQVYTNTVEFSLPNGDTYTTNPSSSGKDHVSATGHHWHQKAIVSVTEAGGLTWLRDVGGRANSGIVKKTRTRDRAERAIPAPEANAELQVNLDADIDGWIEVSAKNKRTEKELVDLNSHHGYGEYALAVAVVQMKSTVLWFVGVDFDVYVGDTLLIYMYIVVAARKLFNEMPVINAVFWTALLLVMFIVVEVGPWSDHMQRWDELGIRGGRGRPVEKNRRTW
ncbi:hypothetical protein GIB67_015372 [Kingdonia uniflora]|uniref:Uncharacterized protein n=1 Tax=Kingdonia uniflora TaxID=39325 RepID=A0A7J7KYU5_9MAGN|nr:hypothetical protein GIB67_015372 [Kingdonia uniflora]